MSNYTENQYVNDKNNSWNIILGLISTNQKVIDIGCSSGNFGAELHKQKNCVVDGIEIDDADVKLAQSKIRKVYKLNVETDDLSVIKDKYDVVLMMDVIEHLARPAETLEKISRLLKPDGKLIFSVPNMAHISVRLELLAGKFNYRKTGLLDDTHLHFYTEKYLLNVLERARYGLIKTEVTTVSYPKQLVAKKLNEIGLNANDNFQKTISNSHGNIYQFIGVAKLGSVKDQPTFPSSNIHEEHYREIEQTMESQSEQISGLHQQLQTKNQYIKSLEEQNQRIVNSAGYKIAKKTVKSYRKVKGKFRTKTNQL
ncbi:MAG TPA: class I SAM-dependent methyltransferase [Candidatus Saccharimonadales bacterium]|nr:class I SAM-dependent methyltransferase [Candidatus Saccharimonadales bacterium]